MSDRTQSQTQDRLIEALLHTARQLLAATDDPTVGTFLAEWPARVTPSRHVDARPLPVLDWIDDLEQAAVPSTRAFVHAFVDGARSLAWAQTYASEDFGAGFLDRYAWSELMGLRGPVASTRLATGFLLLGPEIEYPLHSHDARETYLPVAGTAHWKVGDGDWILRPPGVLIYHASGMPHAMRTEREPLLAFYVWEGGNLAQKSKIL
jgi:mannose-6-phosphate isomerase-like protein (cupin superfamily)